MAIVSFPQDIDGLRPSEIISEPIENVYSVVAFSGAARHAEYPHPVWLVDLVWEGRSAGERAAIHGFFAGLGGPLGVFRIDAYDYPSHRGGLTGTISVGSAGQLGRGLTVTAPSGTSPYLRAGDRINLDDGEAGLPYRYVHVVTQDWTGGQIRIAPAMWVPPTGVVKYQGMSGGPGSRVRWVLRLRDARQASMVTRPPMESDFRVSCISEYVGLGI